MDFFFFKQKTAYEMRISYWSSDVCSSDLGNALRDRRQDRTDHRQFGDAEPRARAGDWLAGDDDDLPASRSEDSAWPEDRGPRSLRLRPASRGANATTYDQGGGPMIAHLIRWSVRNRFFVLRSEEHTSELQSLIRTTYAVFGLKK